MSVIDLKFANQPTLHLSIDNNEVGKKYFDLVKATYKKQKPIYRDRLNYNLDYMRSLLIDAKNKLGWTWEADYDIIDETLLHKDIEKLLGKIGFKDVACEHDNLLHELHYCLHLLQHNKPSRLGWLQVEWYNNEGFVLDEKFIFSKGLNFGDVKLQNPWVGHGPLQVYLEKDFTNISQTCKFHDFVKPGINIVTVDFPNFHDVDKLIKEFNQHDPDFVKLHGIEKISQYIGHPVIGKVINLDDLMNVITAPTLEFESLEFHEQI